MILADLEELFGLVKELRKHKIEPILIGGQSVSLTEGSVETKDSDFLLTNPGITRLEDALRNIETRGDYRFNGGWDNFKSIYKCMVKHLNKEEYKVDFIDAYTFTPSGTDTEDFYTVAEEKSTEKEGIRVALSEIVVYTRLRADPSWKRYVEKTVRNAVELYKNKEKKFDLNKVYELMERMGDTDGVRSRLEYLKKALKEAGLPY